MSGVAEGPALAGCAALIAPRLNAIADSARFQNVILAVIVANAAVLGLQTYDAINDEIGGLLVALDGIFLGVFCVELAIRIGAYGRRPQDFFKEPWNVFDFVVIGAAFLPFLRENATLLRLVRLFRVVRIVSVLPDLRVLVRGMVSSLAPIASLAALAVLVMYIYGMLGWILFGQGDPERWGDIGDALLTLFVVMTLESWPDIMGAAQEITPWAWLYFVSYVLVASFLIINVVIAIIITAVEEAHQEEREEAAERARAQAAADAESTPPIADQVADPVAVGERLAELRALIDGLEAELAGEPAATEATRPERRRVRGASKARMKP